MAKLDRPDSGEDKHGDKHNDETSESLLLHD